MLHQKVQGDSGGDEAGTSEQITRDYISSEEWHVSDKFKINARCAIDQDRSCPRFLAEQTIAERRALNERTPTLQNLQRIPSTMSSIYLTRRSVSDFKCFSPSQTACPAIRPSTYFLFCHTGLGWMNEKFHLGWNSAYGWVAYCDVQESHNSAYWPKFLCSFYR